MSGNVVVTGASGFLGKHVREAFRAAGYNVYGVTRNGSPGDDRACVCDVTDRVSVAALLQSIQPDFIVHAVGGGHGSADFEELARLHVTGTVSFLEAVRCLKRAPRIVMISSSAVYGVSTADKINEEHPLLPVTPYGLAKLAEEQVVEYAGRTHGLDLLRVRLFNLIGPGMPSSLAAGSFARQIVQIERGLKAPTLEVGNLASSRDFIDVRDAANAIVIACRQGQTGKAYNVCSGEAVLVGDILKMLITRSTVDPIEVNLLRVSPSNDVNRQCGDRTLIRTHTQWEPTTSLSKSLTDTLSFWRSSDSR